MKKRLIDIYPVPPIREIAKEEQTRGGSEERALGAHARKIPRGRFVLASSLMLFALPLLFLHFFFARAAVQVWPQITRFHVTEQIAAQVGADKIHVEKRVIRALQFEEDAEGTQLFPSSGTAQKEEQARGVIRVYNEYSTQPQALVANTRFISEDGKIFRSEKAVAIPGRQTDGRRLIPGFLDVPVVAGAPGSEYNIGTSRFSLPGLAGSPSYTKIYGESTQAMSGGIQREVRVATEEDIARARDQLVETLNSQAVKSLLARMPPHFQIVGDTLKTTVAEDKSLIKPGAELDQFYYTVKVRASMQGFHKEEADFLTKHLLKNYLGANQEINEKSLRIAYELNEGADGAGLIPLSAQIQFDRYEVVDARAVQGRMRGISRDGLRELMREYPLLAKAQVSLWPLWLSAIPRNLERITIEVLLEG